MWLHVVLSASALGAPARSPGPEPVLTASTDASSTCAISAFWERVPEVALDRPLPPGAVVVRLPVGCHFVAPPGAEVSLGGLRVPVVGIRRVEGQLLVAAPPERVQGLLQAAARNESPVVTRDGDWRALLNLVNAAQR